MTKSDSITEMFFDKYNMVLSIDADPLRQKK